MIPVILSVQIEGVVNSWDQSSLSERYLQACRSCHTGNNTLTIFQAENQLLSLACTDFSVGIICDE